MSLKTILNTWNNNQMYIDNNGNYRWNTTWRVKLPKGAIKGRIVPFNKKIKEEFNSVSELHKEASRLI